VRQVNVPLETPVPSDEAEDEEPFFGLETMADQSRQFAWPLHILRALRFPRDAFQGLEVLFSLTYTSSAQSDK